MSERWWLRGLDLNQRPSGYEPDELPDCSTPRHLVFDAQDYLLRTIQSAWHSAKPAGGQSPYAKLCELCSGYWQLPENIPESEPLAEARDAKRAALVGQPFDL